jgi:hypothetical protein
MSITDPSLTSHGHPYDQLNRIHSLTAILTEAVKYKVDHGNAKFARPAHLPLYDKTIANNVMTVICAEASQISCLDDYASYKAAKHGVFKFLQDIVIELWNNDLKDAKTFYTKVMTLNVMALLNANSGGLHAVDMISLHTNMMQYYVQADGIPQFIVMIEDAQKKTKPAGMPITNVELVMMDLAAVFAAQHFSREVDIWEGLPVIDQSWQT